MNTEAASTFYEGNKEYIANKITILNLALAALEDAILAASRNSALAGTRYNLEDFRNKQAYLIFEEVMSMSSTQIEEILRSARF